ncbi:hypothetical protein [Flavobacterium sp.]|uniref:hypothetical protein n=1 Tax=Flavobacterium sp. TaxID=239 RepID=UPI0037C131E4
MEKVIILYKPEVEIYLNGLIFDLFHEKYFSYLENSILYKDKIIDFIESDIATFPSKKTPAALKTFGSKYIFYKSNQRTTWYVFFENKDNNYLITNIINSHYKETKWL